MNIATADEDDLMAVFRIKTMDDEVDVDELYQVNLQEPLIDEENFRKALWHSKDGLEVDSQMVYETFKYFNA